MMIACLTCGFINAAHHRFCLICHEDAPVVDRTIAASEPGRTNVTRLSRPANDRLGGSLARGFRLRPCIAIPASG